VIRVPEDVHVGPLVAKLEDVPALSREHQYPEMIVFHERRVDATIRERRADIRH
jgi:hypothetical protein